VADGTTPLAQAYRTYEQFEGQLSTALDQLVATNGFADLLATSATTVMAMTRLVNGAVDRAVRSTRLAARQDVTELARQLARTEDKLERLLELVEQLQESAGPVSPPTTAPAAAASAQAPASGANGTSGRPRATAAARRRPSSGAPGTGGRP